MEGSSEFNTSFHKFLSHCSHGFISMLVNALIVYGVCALICKGWVWFYHTTRKSSNVSKIRANKLWKVTKKTKREEPHKSKHNFKRKLVDKERNLNCNSEGKAIKVRSCFQWLTVERGKHFNHFNTVVLRVPLLYHDPTRHQHKVCSKIIEYNNKENCESQSSNLYKIMLAKLVTKSVKLVQFCSWLNQVEI